MEGIGEILPRVLRRLGGTKQVRQARLDAETTCLTKNDSEVTLWRDAPDDIVN